MKILKNLNLVIILGLIFFKGQFSFAGDGKLSEKTDVIAVSAPELNTSGITQEQQDNGQIILGRKIQLALRNAFECRSSILPVSLYRKHPSDIFEFYYTSDECKIRLKEGGICDVGFNAKYPPKGIGMDKYKICVKSVSGTVTHQSDSGPVKSSR